MTTSELELEYQLLKRNNPEWSEEKLRQEMFNRAMQGAADDMVALGYIFSHEAATFNRNIR